MRIFLTHTTCTIELPDHWTIKPHSAPDPADDCHANADGPLAVLNDLLGKLRTEMATGRDGKIWTKEKPIYGTPIT